ncbi:hypothetical protein DENSPDRAFT_886484 [Dentipellis sp. KUC8613]|nr:hypothetical protein DENSPDRAFT_886484 [Dentipellis sp. KUC8613]
MPSCAVVLSRRLLVRHPATMRRPRFDVDARCLLGMCHCKRRRSVVRSPALLSRSPSRPPPTPSCHHARPRRHHMPGGTVLWLVTPRHPRVPTPPPCCRHVCPHHDHAPKQLSHTLAASLGVSPMLSLCFVPTHRHIYVPSCCCHACIVVLHGCRLHALSLPAALSRPAAPSPPCRGLSCPMVASDAPPHRLRAPSHRLAPDRVVMPAAASRALACPAPPHHLRALPPSAVYRSTAIVRVVPCDVVFAAHSPLFAPRSAFHLPRGATVAPSCMPQPCRHVPLAPRSAVVCRGASQRCRLMLPPGALALPSHTLAGRHPLSPMGAHVAIRHPTAPLCGPSPRALLSRAFAPQPCTLMSPSRAVLRPVARPRHTHPATRALAPAPQSCGLWPCAVLALPRTAMLTPPFHTSRASVALLCIPTGLGCPAPLFPHTTPLFHPTIALARRHEPRTFPHRPRIGISTPSPPLRVLALPSPRRCHVLSRRRHVPEQCHSESHASISAPSCRRHVSSLTARGPHAAVLPLRCHHPPCHIVSCPAPISLSRACLALFHTAIGTALPLAVFTHAHHLALSPTTLCVAVSVSCICLPLCPQSQPHALASCMLSLLSL